MNAGDAQALSAANAYTDGRLAGMSANVAAATSRHGRFAMSAGFQNGKQAVSVGYGWEMGERSSFTLSGAFSGSDRLANVGFGVDL